MTRSKYLVVLNKYTGRDVPFRISQEREIIITSTNGNDTDENCEVRIVDIFYEHALDLEFAEERLGFKYGEKTEIVSG